MANTTNKDTIRLLEGLISKTIRKGNLKSANLVREGIVISVLASSRLVTVKTSGGDIIENIRYQKGATAVVGDACLIISSDPNTLRRNRAIIF